MHRQSELTAGFVGFTSGGVRSLVDEIDDKTGMQEMKGSMMFGEARDRVESPQNYGMTSVVMPATKDKNGKIEECAEAYINYLGGNRSFPICSVMDDRRYRLKELKPGDVAFYDHQQQQFHFNKDGAFLTGLDNKKIRFSLLKVEDEQQQQGGGGGGVSTLAESGGGSSGQSGGSQKKKGQKQRYEKAEKESKRFMDLNEKNIGVAHDADIGIKAGKTLATEGQAIKRKAEAHYFDGDVHVTGNLYISKQGFKPTGPEWAPGTATPGPSDSDDVAKYVKRPPRQLTAEQHAAFQRQRAFIDIIEKIRVTDSGLVIDGDLAVTGNLTVTGVVRAKGFELVP